jgi:hypothetical protein
MSFISILSGPLLPSDVVASFRNLAFLLSLLGRSRAHAEQQQRTAGERGMAQPDERRERPAGAEAEAGAEEELGVPGYCWAVIFAVLALLVGGTLYIGSQPVDPLDSMVTEFRGDGVLRTVVWAGRAGGAPEARGGHNDAKVSWAIFFYK